MRKASLIVLSIVGWILLLSAPADAYLNWTIYLTEPYQEIAPDENLYVYAVFSNDGSSDEDIYRVGCQSWSTSGTPADGGNWGTNYVYDITLAPGETSDPMLMLAFDLADQSIPYTPWPEGFSDTWDIGLLVNDGNINRENQFYSEFSFKVTVPEPGTFWLLGSCVVGLLGFRRRSK